MARKLSDPRWYTAEFKALAILYWKMSPGGLLRVASELGISKSLLYEWGTGKYVNERVGELVNRHSSDIQEMLAELRDLVATDMKEKIIKGEARGSVKDYSMALGILTDKIRLLNGEATSITESRKTSAKESLKQKIKQMSVVDLTPAEERVPIEQPAD
jgi:hypothetical protein